MTAVPVAAGAPRTAHDTVAEAADRCASIVADSAIRAGRRAGWVSWELDGSGVARGGDSSLYTGDAGAAWACSVLAAPLRRPELAELADRARAAVAARSPGDVTLLSGAAGTALAGGELPRVDPARVPAADLAGGLAGVLLAQVRTGARAARIAATADALVARSRDADGGRCWTDPAPAGEAERPLCGLAHGAAGIALALAEAAVVTGRATHARAAEAALRWERLWFDPLRGWPDLRGDAPSYPAYWCHGAAGIGVARLRLGELARAHPALGLPADVLRAEAEAAVGFALAALERTAAAADEYGAAAVPAGLTLCHGSGGALDLLASAAAAWQDDDVLVRARGLAARLLAALGEDPQHWPSGTAVPGGAGLFLGLSGTAVVLARLVDPGLPSPSLLPG